MNMKLKKYSYLILSSAVLGLIMSSCNYFTAPTSIWDPNKQYRVGAVITGVSPSNSSIAGVREIRIIGKNFSSVIDSNWVWFGTLQATIKRVSLNSTADTIVVYRPPNSGSLTLKVVILAADSIGTYPYSLESPVSSSDISAITGTYLVMEAGKGDTMFIASTGYINKLSPNGIDMIAFKDTSYLKPKIGSKATDFANSFVDMKFGPGGVLYATFNKSNTIYRIDPDSSSPVVYARLTTNNAAGNFDFDDNGNLYTGKSAGLFLVKTDGTSSAVGDYSGFTFVEIRVIKDSNGNKFVYAANSSDLYRSQINSDGTVANKQLVASIANDTSFINNKISSFNVGSDGTVFVSVTGNSNYSLFVFQNGTLTPYYKEKILPTGVDQLIWGNDRFLYLSRGKTGAAADTRFYRMGIGREDGTALNGAPYLGRGL